MRIPLLFLAAMAAEPPGFVPVREEGGCAFAATAPDAAGFPVLRAECHWPEVPPARLAAVLADWSGHQAIWSTVTSSTVVETQGEAALVRHVHEAPAMVDREVLLRMWVEPVESGQAFRWTRAVPQPSPCTGRVTVERDDGSYTVRAEGEGSWLVATLYYDPGGWVPAPLVRWFQVMGMPGMLAELKAAALGAPAPSGG